MEELKKKLKEIKRTLSYMQALNLIGLFDYKTLDKLIDEALSLNDENIIAVDNLFNRYCCLGFSDEIKYENNSSNTKQC
jgi:hypothetical protein